MPQNKKQNFAIIGAGMGGTLMGIYLASRGFQVDIFERRADMRRHPVEPGRSINMTLAARGLHALAKAGLHDVVMAMTVPLRGRMVHAENGTVTAQPYGKNDTEVHHSIKRSQLNITLINYAESFPSLRLFFNQRCISVKRETGLLRLYDEESGRVRHVTAGVIIGADGAFSTVREEMQRDQTADFYQEYLPEGYKELAITPDAVGNYQVDEKSLHVWPRGAMVLIAIPNADGSFTCTLTLPYQGEFSFASLKTPSAVRGYFQRFYPEVLSLAPGIPTEFLSHPPGKYLTTKTCPWYYKGGVVLIGDACHSVLPFYGQGMNAAFEDCVVLADCLDSEPGDTEAAFVKYQHLRKRNTDALADLSIRNYFELREKVRSPLFVARKNLEIKLTRAFPNLYVPLYSLVTHTTTPYADAVERCMRQDRLLRLMGLDAVLPVLAAPALFAQWRKRFSRWADIQSRRLPGAAERAADAAGAAKS